MLCSVCKKNTAIIFTNKISEDKPILYVTTNINLDIKKLRDVKLVMDDLNMNKVKELIRIDKEYN